jgi:excisionase family DNA binding protein
MTAQPAMSVQDIAAELNVSAFQVHQMIAAGDIPALNIGTGQRSFWRVQREDFDRYVSERKAATARRFGRAS